MCGADITNMLGEIEAESYGASCYGYQMRVHL